MQICSSVSERLKLEEEERIKSEAEKAERLKVEGARLAVETARLQSERDEEIPFHTQRKNALQIAHADTSAEIEWERYIECIPRPNPLFDSDLNGYLLTLQERAQKVLDETLKTCQDNELVRTSGHETLQPHITLSSHNKLYLASTNMPTKRTAMHLQNPISCPMGDLDSERGSGAYFAAVTFRLCGNSGAATRVCRGNPLALHGHDRQQHGAHPAARGRVFIAEPAGFADSTERACALPGGRVQGMCTSVHNTHT
eukprot:914588-Prorocentrum_minimum.AAC.2